MSRIDRPEWTAANKVGVAGEIAVADLLRKIGFAVKKTQARCADLEIDATVEVKTDRKSHTTGNVAVEVSYRGRPSGVRTTCANIWIFVLVGTGEFLAIQTDRLAEAVAELPDVRGGEHAVIRLLPVAELRKLSISIGSQR